MRYFDVAHKASGDYGDVDDGDDEADPFAKAMDTLVEEVLIPSVGGKISNVDWRVIKKILNIKEIFEKNSAVRDRSSIFTQTAPRPVT